LIPDLISIWLFKKEYWRLKNQFVIIWLSGWNTISKINQAVEGRKHVKDSKITIQLGDTNISKTFSHFQTIGCSFQK